MKRTAYGIEVDGVEYNTSLTNYLNTLCVKSYSTFEGRVCASRMRLNKNYKVPVYIDDSTCLILTKTLRDFDTILINYHTILNIVRKDHGTIIVFDDNTELTINISKKVLVSQLKLCENLLGYNNLKKVFTI